MKILPTHGVFAYALTNRRVFLGIVLLVALAFVCEILFGWMGWIEWADTWEKRIDPLIGLATLVIASFVWLGETREEWSESLPKRLDVLFVYNGIPLMECQGAHLSSVADIRQLGQQIGGQMGHTRNLRFRAPMVRMSIGELSDDKSYTEHKAVFFLTALPGEGGKEEDEKHARTFFETLTGEEKCLVWRAPFGPVHLGGEASESNQIEPAHTVSVRWPKNLLYPDL